MSSDELARNLKRALIETRCIATGELPNWARLGETVELLDRSLASYRDSLAPELDFDEMRTVIRDLAAQVRRASASNRSASRPNLASRIALANTS